MISKSKGLFKWAEGYKGFNKQNFDFVLSWILILSKEQEQPADFDRIKNIVRCYYPKLWLVWLKPLFNYLQCTSQL